MALTTDETRIVREIVSRRHPIQGCVKEELRQAIADTDAWIEANQAEFNAALPLPFRTVATTQEKTLLFCYVAAKRAGLLPEGGL